MQYDPLMVIFAGAVGLASILTIYLIIKAGRKRRKNVAKAEKIVEEMGVEIPKEELKKILKEELKTDVEEEIKSLAEKEAEKRLRKATRGLHKAKGQRIVIWYEGQIGENVVTLGKLHSYDRLSLDGSHGYYVFYYFPSHNSIFLNGVQQLIKIFGRGKKRLEIPDELVLSIGTKEIIIHAKTLQSVDGNTFRVVAPERIEPVIEENRFLRKAYRRLSELNTELLKDMNRAVKLGIFANPFFRQYYTQQRVLQGLLDEETESEFYALEGKKLKEERLRRAYEKLQSLNARVEGGERYV
ncbi:hypothetical protein DRO97_01995 [Archaeoglobales archaeon]|nr:MAG: hypothetical protein DRO97_01995 [Archaeoglobales archaeon]